MATLGVTFTGAALSMGGKKAEDASTPPINAKSPDEENFVKCVYDILRNPRNSPGYCVCGCCGRMDAADRVERC
jgi:hypothetical protein